MRILIGIALATPMGIGASYSYAAGRQRYTVALPPANTSPQQVVTAFLRALDAHDATTAKRLVTADTCIGVDGWLQKTARVRNIKVTTVRWAPDHVQHSDGAYRQAYDVCVAFTYQAHWWSTDVAFLNGYHPFWCYAVVQDRTRWLIRDNGEV